MTGTSSSPVRLTPELQADYQQTFNNPAKKGSPEWYIAAKGLYAAGVINTDPLPPDELRETLSVSDSNTDQQSL